MPLLTFFYSDENFINNCAIMTQQVRADFDFDAQPGSGELSIHANEVLEVIRQVT